jgi:hypothetical protein
VRRPQSVGPGHARKIGIIGTHAGSLMYAPWYDPSWEFWAHASGALKVPEGRADLFFDLHPEHCFTKERKNGFKDYYKWLQRLRTPVMMQQTYEAVPASKRYPLEQVRQEFPGLTFGGHVAYMIALALIRGVTHIGLWGCEYSGKSEYALQRGNCQMWIGIAIGRGVQIIVPKTCTLLVDSGEDYAYDTHATPEKWEEWKIKIGVAEKAEDAVKSAKSLLGRLQPVITPEDSASAAAQRAQHDPEWLKLVKQLEPETAGAPT